MKPKSDFLNDFKELLLVFKEKTFKIASIKETLNEELLKPFKFENYAVTLDPHYFLYLYDLFDDVIFSRSEVSPYIAFRDHMRNKYKVGLMGDSYLFIKPDRRIQPRHKENIKKDFKSILKNSIMEYLYRNIKKSIIKEMELSLNTIKDKDLPIKDKREELWKEYELIWNNQLEELLKNKDFESLLDDPFYETEPTNSYSQFPLRTIHMKGIGEKTFSLLYENDIRTVGQLYDLIHKNPNELETIKGISTNTISLLDQAIKRTNFSIYFIISDLNYENMVKEVMRKAYPNFNLYYDSIKNILVDKIKTDYPFKYGKFLHPKNKVNVWRIYDFKRLSPEDFSTWRRVISKKGGYWSRVGRAFYFDKEPSKEDLEEIMQKYLSFKD